MTSSLGVESKTDVINLKRGMSASPHSQSLIDRFAVALQRRVSDAAASDSPRYRSHGQ